MENHKGFYYAKKIYGVELYNSRWVKVFNCMKEVKDFIDRKLKEEEVKDNA